MQRIGCFFDGPCAVESHLERPRDQAAVQERLFQQVGDQVAEMRFGHCLGQPFGHERLFLDLEVVDLGARDDLELAVLTLERDALRRAFSQKAGVHAA